MSEQELWFTTDGDERYEELSFLWYEHNDDLPTKLENGYGYVYLYEWDKTTTKIGKTADIKNRFRVLRRDSKNKGGIYVSQPCKDYSELEAKLHNLFAVHRLSNYSDHVKKELYDVQIDDCVKQVEFLHIQVYVQPPYDLSAELRAKEFIMSHLNDGAKYDVAEMRNENIKSKADRNRLKLEEAEKIKREEEVCKKADELIEEREEPSESKMKKRNSLIDSLNEPQCLKLLKTFCKEVVKEDVYSPDDLNILKKLINLVEESST